MDPEVAKAINEVSKKAFQLNQTTDNAIHNRCDNLQSSTDETICDLLVDMACSQQGVETPNYAATTLEATENDGESAPVNSYKPVSYKYRVAHTMVNNFVRGRSTRSKEEIEERLSILQQSNFITDDEMLELLEILDTADKKEDTTIIDTPVDTQEPTESEPVAE